MGITEKTGSAAECKHAIGDHFELMIAYQWDETSWGGGFESSSTEYTDPMVYMNNR